MIKKAVDLCLPIVIILLTLCLAACFVLAGVSIEQRRADPDHFETYMVAPGDTLWAIAGKTNGADMVDKRRIVDIIEAENGIRANIKPGQVIRIPVWDF